MKIYNIQIAGKNYAIKQDEDGKFIMPKELKQWEPYGSAMKPAWEPIIVAMKPLDGTFAHNAEKHGVAGLNINGARIGTETRSNPEAGFIRRGRTDEEVFGQADKNKPDNPPHQVQSRFPANLILDEEAAAMLDEQSGISKSTDRVRKNNVGWGTKGIYGKGAAQNSFGHKDSGGASRFFYCAKAYRSERNAGLKGMEAVRRADRNKADGVGGNNPRNRTNTPKQNHHPTVKPLKLMQYLCRLLKPPEGGLLLDPFCGSGTTLMAAVSEGWDYIGIEKEAEYVEIAGKRVEWIKEHLEQQDEIEAQERKIERKEP